MEFKTIIYYKYLACNSGGNCNSRIIFWEEYQNSVFAVFWLLFPCLVAIFGWNLTQNYTQIVQCSIIIRGFKVLGN